MKINKNLFSFFEKNVPVIVEKVDPSKALYPSNHSILNGKAFYIETLPFHGLIVEHVLLLSITWWNYLGDEVNHASEQFEKSEQQYLYIFDVLGISIPKFLKG